MNEIALGLKALIALGVSCLYATLCMFCGRDIALLGINQRVWGRVIAPLIFVSTTLTLGSFHPQYLIAFPLYLASHTLGYGGSDWKTKFTRRGLWSIGRTLAAVVFVRSAGDFTLFLLQITLGLVATCVLGLFNPIIAPEEELLINFSNVFLVPFMVLN